MIIDRTVWLIFSFCLGCCIASFLNVVIWRVPRGESIVSPSSHCPRCNHLIRAWQNIPLLSWLVLRGRCAFCKAPISPRYFCVELLGGLLFLAASAHFGFWAPLAWIWIALMIAGSFIDFDHQLLPDFTTVGGMALGMLLALIQLITGIAPAADHAAAVLMPHPALALIGMVVGLGLLWLIRFIGSLVFRQEAMGLGDVFLMGAIGALFGPIAVLVTLILSAFVGSIVGLALVALSKARIGGHTAIPYGPYLCMGCLVWMFYGPELVDLYLKFIGFGAV